MSIEDKIELSVPVENVDVLMNVFGNMDENIKLISEKFEVIIITRENKIKISGLSENATKAQQVLKRIIDIALLGETVTKQSVSYLVNLTSQGELDLSNGYMDGVVCLTARGRQIKAKTHGQKQYVEAIRNHDISFGIGPAGTGKTFLAVALAVNAFRNKKVSKIVLTRPAVEAGEKLGFLPGDLQDKVDPYLRPLYDSLNEIMGAETFSKNFEKGLIEVAPLAYMRGRTLDDAFIILDEAQNTTPEQMKMFLTRLGFGSKAVVNGDITQIDLPPDKKSGLKEVVDILQSVKGISFTYLTEKDVVRHELVQRIIRAYEIFQSKN